MKIAHSSEHKPWQIRTTVFSKEILFFQYFQCWSRFSLYLIEFNAMEVIQRIFCLSSFIVENMILFYPWAAILQAMSPLIVPMDPDISIAKGSNVTLKCYSNQPIRWLFPWDVGQQMYWNIPAIMYGVKYQFNKKKLTYITLLELYGVRNEMVGFYYCMKNSSHDEMSEYVSLENHSASKIYLYVEGNSFSNYFYWTFSLKWWIFQTRTRQYFQPQIKWNNIFVIPTFHASQHQNMEMFDFCR